MICPRCVSSHTKVLKTVKSTTTERFRKCMNCGYLWNTVELPKNDKYLSSYVKSLFDTEKEDDTEK